MWPKESNLSSCDHSELIISWVEKFQMPSQASLTIWDNTPLGKSTWAGRSDATNMKSLRSTHLTYKCHCRFFKGKKNGHLSLQLKFLETIMYNYNLIWNSVFYFKGQLSIILILISRNIFQKCNLILLFVFKYSFPMWWSRNLKFKWILFL